MGTLVRLPAVLGFECPICGEKVNIGKDQNEHGVYLWCNSCRYYAEQKWFRQPAPTDKSYVVLYNTDTPKHPEYLTDAERAEVKEIISLMIDLYHEEPEGHAYVPFDYYDDESQVALGPFSSVVMLPDELIMCPENYEGVWYSLDIDAGAIVFKGTKYNSFMTTKFDKDLLSGPGGVSVIKDIIKMV